MGKKLDRVAMDITLGAILVIAKAAVKALSKK